MAQKRRYTFDGRPIYLLGERATEFFGQMKVQDFYVLRQQHLEAKTLFEDSEFPATDQSLFSRQNTDKPCVWLRPFEICKDAQFFVKGYSRFDVKQGDLYDCWFLAAAANLTLNQKLFSRVVCDDNSLEENYAGIFHFCFWRFGKWVDVVIDDRLPTYDGKLIYNRSIDKNEFWSALLEKAYAKLNGSYAALVGGNTSEALEDFSGGITERYSLKEAPTNLFNIIENGFERNSMMGCSIDPDIQIFKNETPEGLIKGHAYSITKVQLVDIVTKNKNGKIPLLRLRNPWGDDIEWNGPWSDGSREWQLIPETTKKDIGLTFDSDGEFWMSYTDFIKHFDHMEICNLSPDSLTEEQRENLSKKWNLNVFEGQWISGLSAGGCNNIDKFYCNPQYIINLETPDHDSKDGKCSLVVALMQKNRRNRKKTDSGLLTIGFKIFKLSEDDLTQKPFKRDFFRYNTSIERSTFINLREVSARFKLAPGHYLIVPSTYEPNEEGEFLIRVFSESKNNFEKHDEDIGVGEVDSRIAESLPDIDFPTADWLEIEKLFHDIAEENKEIGWMGLKQILEVFMGDKPLKHTMENGNSNTQPNQEINHSNKSETYLQTIWNYLLCKEEHHTETDVPLLNGTNNSGNKKVSIQTQPKDFEFSKDVCRSMVAMLDIDQSGKLGLDELKVLIYEINKWKVVFKLYDKDQNNKLDSLELRDVLASAGYRLNNQILGSLFYRYGSSDGTMTIDDFIMCAVKVKTMIERFKENDINQDNRATFTIDEWMSSVLYS